MAHPRCSARACPQGPPPHPFFLEGPAAPSGPASTASGERRVEWVGGQSAEGLQKVGSHGAGHSARSRTAKHTSSTVPSPLSLNSPFWGRNMNARRAPQDKSKRKEETSQVNGRHNRRVWRGGRTSGLGGRAAAAGRRGGVSFQGISTGLVTTTPIGPHKNLEMNALYTLGLNALRSTHTQSLRLRRPRPR